MSLPKLRWKPLFLLVALFFLAAAPAHGAEKRARWERIDVTITVHEDGTFTVEEVMQVRFQGGSFSFGYRDIDKNRLEAIDDIRVWDEEGEYVQDESFADRTFHVNETAHVVSITWYFPPVEDATRTFHLRYRVHGGLRAYPGGDQLWWKAVFPERESSVAQSTVTVIAPAAVTVYDSYFVPAEARLLDERTVQFRTLKPVPPQTSFEVRVQWPHGVIPATPAPWQAQADAEAERIIQRERRRPILTLAFIFGSIGLALIGLLTLFLLWYFRGRNRDGTYIDYLPEPPSDLPPALAGQLLDTFIRPRHILATILDLANRGVLTIEELPRRRGEPLNFRFRLVAGFPADLTTFERRTLRAVMGRSQTKTLKDVRKRFSKHVKKITEAQEDALVERGLFPEPPTQSARPYGWVSNAFAIAVAMMFLFMLFDGPKWLGVAQELGLWPLGSFLLLSIAFHVGKYVLIPRTPQGYQEAARWQAFRRYLAELKAMPETPPAQAILARYLPYAVAFGVEKAFLAVWEDQEGGGFG